MKTTLKEKIRKTYLYWRIYVWLWNYNRDLAIRIYFPNLVKNLSDHGIDELTKECNGTYIGDQMVVVECGCKDEN